MQPSSSTDATRIRGHVLASLLGAVLALLAMGPASAQVDTYRILMKNGTTFLSAERPQIAWFDENKILIRSEGGHIVGLELDEIESVNSELEFEGYGVLLNKTTILVGNVANDAPVPDPEAALNSGLPPNLSSVLINQPFLAGTSPQTFGSGSSSPFGSGTGADLEAPVYQLPP